MKKGGLHKDVLLYIEWEASVHHDLFPLSVFEELETNETQVKVLPINKQLLYNIPLRRNNSYRTHKPSMPDRPRFHLCLILIP